MTDKMQPADAGQPGFRSGDPRSMDVKLAVASLKLKAQELGRAGNAQAAEAILLKVLELQPDDPEALALQAIVDSEHGRHALAVRRGLRAAQLTHWRAPPICENLALFIRRLSNERERARVLRKSLPILARQEPSPRAGELPLEPYDVVVLCPGPTTAASRFEEVFELQRAGTGRVVKLGMAGSARDRVRESLQRAESGLLVFVNADDVPTDRFTALVTLLERCESRDWAFAQATSLDEPASPGGSAYGAYRKLLEGWPHLPCPDFALFEQADATGGVICIRRAALERIASRLPDLPFSVRAVAIQAALESSPAMLAAEAVARPAAGFERDRAAAPPLLTMALETLLADEARNTNAPMPREWGVLAWSVAAAQGVAQRLSVRHWQRLDDEVASLERQFAAESPRRGGVNLIGLSLGMFGLAESMRAFVRAADRANVASCIGDLGTGTTLKANECDPRLLDRLRDRFPYRTSIVLANPDILHNCWPAQLLEADRYRIGYWFWEFDSLPKEWAYAFDLVDEIWVATEFVRAAVARSTDKPVTLIPHPIEVEVRKPRPKSAFGLDEDVFWFLVTFDFNAWIERKNPYAAIKAFRAAFAEGSEKVGLCIKTIFGDRQPHKLAALRAAIDGDERIVLRDEPMPRDDVLALLNAADCYVSLHRSEGLGLGLAESMYLGKPVIGTAYSGNAEFMTDENSCPVRYSLVPVQPGEYIYSRGNAFHWAEADVGHAAWCMRRIAAEPQFRQSIARRASADIRARFDTRVIGQMMRARLGEIDAG
jgi:glycosyltransferase involved in cell wall biosynthesis